MTFLSVRYGTLVTFLMPFFGSLSVPVRKARSLALAASLSMVGLSGGLQSVCAAESHVPALTQLRAFLKDSRTARGEFMQRTTAPGRAARSSTGSFEFQRPGRFRWVYKVPYEQLILSDGAQLFIYDKDLNQVTVRAIQASLPASPASILFGSADFERDFDTVEQGARDGLQWLNAKPKMANASFERIDIGMKDGLPAAMRLADTFGQITELSFQKFDRNPTLDAALFRFTPPPGAEVLQDK